MASSNPAAMGAKVQVGDYKSRDPNATRSAGNGVFFATYHLQWDPLSTISDRGIHVADVAATGLFVLNI